MHLPLLCAIVEFNVVWGANPACTLYIQRTTTLLWHTVAYTYVHMLYIPVCPVPWEIQMCACRDGLKLNVISTLPMISLPVSLWCDNSTRNNKKKKNHLWLSFTAMVWPKLKGTLSILVHEVISPISQSIHCDASGRLVPTQYPATKVY